MQALADGFRGGGQAAPARRHLKEIAARSVDFADEIDKAGAIVVFAGRLQQHSARAVAEQDAGGPVGIVDDPAHGIGADHQDFAVRARRDQGRARGQAVQKTGTGGAQVEAPGAMRAQAILNQARGGRKQHVGRHGADQDGVQLGAGDSAGGQRRAGSSVPMSEVAISGAAICRSQIPVRSMIHSLLVSTIRSRSWLVSTPGGT